ncbi:MAG: phosphatidate cytidylyltransferase [Verrucomicrobiota bacterium]
MSEESAATGSDGGSGEGAGAGGGGGVGGAPKKGGVFVSRLVSTLGLWALITVAVLFSQEWLYLVIVELVVLISLAEYFRMADLPRMGWRVWMVMGFAGFYLAGLFLVYSSDVWDQMALYVAFDGMVVVALVLCLFVSEMVRAPEPGETVRRMAVGLLGFAWLVVMFGFVVKILLFGDGTAGVFLVVYLLVVTKFSDMGAYLVGSVVGKHPFMAHISPKKTWEGILGGLMFAVGGSFGVVALFPEGSQFFSWSGAMIVGLILGVVAVLGDLAESVVKRSLAIKDSGHVLPGIGGTIDLIDSICFTAPVMYFLLLFTR